MATIRTAIQIYDGVTSVLRPMTNALNICVSSFEAMQTASSQSVDVSSLSAARAELSKASIAMDSVEQNIREADAAQQQLNQQMRNGQGAADGLATMVKRVAMTIATVIGVGKTAEMSDNLAEMTARLNIMNDGMQTTAQLQQMIFQSAQRSRSVYTDTAAVVSKLGILAKDAFSGNQEMIFFAEQMNKQFKIGGASLQEQTSAMYQLTQAMASGRLQGDEFRSIMENAPMLAQAIATYAGKSMGELREMSSEGLITADIIKNAMFSAAEETNRRFETMPKTFGQIAVSIQNQALMAFQPILVKLNEIANSDRFTAFVNNVVGGLTTLAGAATVTFDFLIGAANFVADNWSMIAPVAWAVAGAFAIYNGVALVTNSILAIQAFRAQVQAAALMMQQGATFSATVAQHGLNAALYACPITWIILAIMALVGVFYLVIAAINKFAGTSLSATGMIVGAFFVAGAAIGNTVIALINAVIDYFALLWNYIAGFAEFFANVFTDPVGSIVRLFANLADTVLGIISGIANAIDTITGSKLADAVEGWRSVLNSAVTAQVGEAAIKVPRVDPQSMRLNRIDYGDAWNAGYSMGEGFENMFDLGNLGMENPALDPALLNDVSNIAAYTKKTADVTEDLKYLRDIAERETINRFTTAEIKLDLTNYNNVSKDTDLDGVVSHFKDVLLETMQSVAEGVHT